MPFLLLGGPGHGTCACPGTGCFAVLFASSAERLVKKGDIVYSIFIEINIKEVVL